MQTFLPSASFVETARVLDYRRLGKQRVEAKQLINTLLNRPTKSGRPRKGWMNHPATLMWKGFVPALQYYHNVMIKEWVRRGYNNNMPLELITEDIVIPPWVGNEVFHASHRSNLLRKDPEYYQQWGWTEPHNLEHIWPNGTI